MSSKVLGVPDLMEDYAEISLRMSDDLGRSGNSVSHAITAFNDRTETRYQVIDCGPGLTGLGDEIATIDSFVRAIALGLRAADSTSISFKLGAYAVDAILETSKDVERLAGDVALSSLLSQFDLFDKAKDNKRDGVVSIKAIERIAESSKNPTQRAAAAWLLDHRKVLEAIDRSDSVDNTSDERITKKDINRFLKQRAAVQVMNDRFDEFDSATTGKTDGKISRQDIEKVRSDSKDPVVRAAAKTLLDDERALNLNATYGDQIAGKYELEKVLNQNGEPTPPMKPQTNVLRDVTCGVAGELSVLSYVDLAVNPLGAKEQASVARSQAESKILKQVAKQAAHKTAAKVAAYVNPC